MVLLDTSAKINIITRKVIENTGLAIQRGLKLKLVFHTGYSHFFLAFVKMLRLL